MVETDDLYEGAFLLCVGAKLTAIQGGSFQFSNDQGATARALQDWREGNPTVYGRELFRCLRELRRKLFAAKEQPDKVEAAKVRAKAVSANRFAVGGVRDREREHDDVLNDRFSRR